MKCQKYVWRSNPELAIKSNKLDFEQFKNKISSKIQKINDESSRILNKINDTKSNVGELFEKVETKLSRNDFEQETFQIWNNFDNYCAFEHLQETREIVMPMVGKFSTRIDEFELLNQQTQEIVSRFDEILLSKASKYDVKMAKEEFDNYTLKSKFNELTDQHRDLKLQVEDNLNV